MATLTRNEADASQVKINGNPSLQAANKEGDLILDEIIKYSKDEAYVKPEKLQYIKASKCWVNGKGKIVIFNIASNESTPINLLKDYMLGLTNSKGKKIKKATVGSPVAGVVSTDRGNLVSTDANEGSTQIVKIDVK